MSWAVVCGNDLIPAFVSMSFQYQMNIGPRLTFAAKTCDPALYCAGGTLLQPAVHDCHCLSALMNGVRSSSLPAAQSWFCPAPGSCVAMSGAEPLATAVLIFWMMCVG